LKVYANTYPSVKIITTSMHVKSRHQSPMAETCMHRKNGDDYWFVTFHHRFCEYIEFHVFRRRFRGEWFICS